MTHIYNQTIAPQRATGGLQQIRVSKWTEDGFIYITLGDYPHQTTFYVTGDYAKRLGWALLRAESSKAEPWQEPDENTDPTQGTNH